MATLLKIFSFTDTPEGWVFNAGGGTGLSTQASSSSPNDVVPTNVGTQKSIAVRRDGKSLSTGTPYYEWSGTWEALGVPVGAVVTAVDLDYDWFCATYSTGASSTVGPAELRDNANVLRKTFSASAPFSTFSTVWAIRDGTNQTGLSDASNTPIKLRINAKPNTGSSTSAFVVLALDYVRVNITYTLGTPNKLVSVV